MSQKTDSPEFAPGFLWQIVSVTVAALCFIMLVGGAKSLSKEPRVSIATVGDRTDVISSPVSIFAWIIGGKQTIVNGLRAFSGRPPVPPPIGDRARALAPLLISLVFCPTIFFLEWRRRRLTKTSSTELPPLRLSSILYAQCGLITVFVSLAIGPIAYVSEKSRASLFHAQAVQGNRDHMINDLNMLAVDATQYYILPKSLGGGERSFEGYALPEKLARSEAASYSVSGGKSMATFHARSAKYSSCAITVNVDSVGHLFMWTYDGEFR